MMRNEKTGFDRILRYIWKWDVNKMNDHLPRKTVPLNELLKEEQPAIKARDGTSLWIDKDELLNIANLVPDDLHSRLHLPIILMRRIDLGEGLFSISGGKLEAFLASKILGITKDSFASYGSADVPQYLYRPQVQGLRRRLRTLSVIGFAGADEQGF
nr:DUF61 family protein [Candidatus Njordarchaeum guaymaensis]